MCAVTQDKAEQTRVDLCGEIAADLGLLEEVAYQSAPLLVAAFLFSRESLVASSPSPKRQPEAP